ncbi:MAG TPA: hypothetical protein VFQ81_11140 [Candidatus Limnocylindria bacterium]|nr:hypothetical protein [Candidatus Limnocylindria bacterium]
MGQMRQWLSWVGIGIVVALTALALAWPLVLRDPSPTAFVVVSLGAGVLGVGLLLRWSDTSPRIMGSTVVVIGAVTVAIGVGLMIASLGGLGY